MVACADTCIYLHKATLEQAKSTGDDMEYWKRCESESNRDRFVSSPAQDQKIHNQLRVKTPSIVSTRIQYCHYILVACADTCIYLPTQGSSDEQAKPTGDIHMEYWKRCENESNHDCFVLYFLLPQTDKYTR